MKKIRLRILNILIIYFFFFAIIHFGFHFYNTNKINQKQYLYTSSDNSYSGCSITIGPRGGVADSWDKRDVSVYGKICTLTGMTYDAVFHNFSTTEASKWNFKIDIEDDCFINKAWCGTVEIHQKSPSTDLSQTLDLRNLNLEDIKLNYILVDQDVLIPLKKGDFIIYHPDEKVKEYPVEAYSGTPGEVTTGFIFYYTKGNAFSINKYSCSYKLKKGYFQGKEPKIYIACLFFWLILVVIRITSIISYKIAKADAEKRMMEEYNKTLNDEVKEKTHHIEKIQEKIVISLANLIENRDDNTGGHVKRTSDVVSILVNEILKQNPELLTQEKADQIIRSASMHDLGKISIDNAILCKPGRLTDEEFAIMKTHAPKSGEIVRLILEDVEETSFVETAFNVARFHHERWDGKGYPEGLTGKKIPVEARIMAIADVYDALVSKRCYKEPMSFEQAYSIMHDGMGSQFDPNMLSVFNACRSHLEEYYSTSN